MKEKGRPASYNNAIHPKLVSHLSAIGYSLANIAYVLGISVATVYKWKEKYPDFAYYLENGRSEANTKVVASLYKKCIGKYYYEKTYELKQDPVKTDKKGKVIQRPSKKKPEYICVRKVRRYMMPDQRSIEFFLTNRDKLNWKISSTIDANMKMEYMVIPPAIPGQGDPVK